MTSFCAAMDTASESLPRLHCAVASVHIRVSGTGTQGQNKNCLKPERLYPEYGSLNYHLKAIPRFFSTGKKRLAGTVVSKNASDRPQKASCFSAPAIGLGLAAKGSDFDSAGLGWKQYDSTKLLLS